MDYNFIWLIGIFGVGLIGYFIYKFNRDPEFFVKLTKYKIYTLIFITWVYRIFVDYHHRCTWQRYLKYINRNKNYFILNNDNEEVKIKNLKKFFWFFQIKYMLRLNKNVLIMKGELENYRLKIKNNDKVSLNSFMKIHKNYKELVSVSDDEFVNLFIEFLGRKPFDYIEKIEIISPISIENNSSMSISIADRNKVD